MWSSPRPETRQLAETACHSCRRRKVKCDRTYPQCIVCGQRDQECNYPPGPLKPGPKIGTMQRRKARRGPLNPRGNNIPVSPRSPSGEQSDVEDNAARPITAVSISANGLINNANNNPNTDGWSPKRDRQLNIHDLSFILHPSHEAPSPDKDLLSVSSHGLPEQERLVIATTCAALGVSQLFLSQAIKVYFANMVAINLFHEPSFRDKITGMGSFPVQVNALLASMLAFAARFMPFEGEADNVTLEPTYFLNLAFSNIDSALKECDDEAPPLCVLQALTVATHCQLTQGVRGKAWRSLGTCIRLAYELNLHLVDADYSSRDGQHFDVQQWCEDEEKRRAWWAIWEMDVFASTIRRTPPAVDWSQMETFLPVEDEDWFQIKPQTSCFMERDPVCRWKSLQECGNKSAKAWFLVVNSLMKEAQVISSPRSIPHRERPDDDRSTKRSTPSHRSRSARYPLEEASKRLELLANSVQCATLALPSSLQYRNQYLSFEARAPGQITSQRQLHCGIYNIYVMSQLSKLMIYRYEVFKGHNSNKSGENDHVNRSSTQTSESRLNQPSSNYDVESLAFKQYFEATDNILTIISRSTDDHIRHINPFLPSTIWLASAVQLLRMQFSRDDISRSLTKSKFEVLYMTYKRCVSFWDIQTALQQNLEALEAQLDDPEISISPSQERTNSPIRSVVQRRRTDHRSRDKTITAPEPEPETESTLVDVNNEYNSSDSLMPGSSETAPFQSTSPRFVYSSQNQMSQQPQASAALMNGFQRVATTPVPSIDHIGYSPRSGLFDAFSMMGHLPEHSRNFFPSTDTMNNTTDLGYDWRNITLPGNIRDVLSGFSAFETL